MALVELEKVLETKIRKGDDLRGYHGLSSGQIEYKQRLYGKNKL